MSQKYSEVLRVRRMDSAIFTARATIIAIRRRVYREKVAQINETLAQRYADHRRLRVAYFKRVWRRVLVSALSGGVSQFLKEKYGDIQTLNHAYWSGFLEPCHNDFDQVEARALMANIRWTA
jgi:beta-galactosidase